ARLYRPSFPTRRSSDLDAVTRQKPGACGRRAAHDRLDERRAALLAEVDADAGDLAAERFVLALDLVRCQKDGVAGIAQGVDEARSEEHTSELQSLAYLV